MSDAKKPPKTKACCRASAAWAAPQAKRKGLACSFCGKGQREVAKLIAGPTTYICNECIGLCNDILDEEREDPKPAVTPTVMSAETLNQMQDAGLSVGAPTLASLQKQLDRVTDVATALLLEKDELTARVAKLEAQ